MSRKKLKLSIQIENGAPIIGPLHYTKEETVGKPHTRFRSTGYHSPSSSRASTYDARRSSGYTGYQQISFLCPLKEIPRRSQIFLLSVSMNYSQENFSRIGRSIKHALIREKDLSNAPEILISEYKYSTILLILFVGFFSEDTTWLVIRAAKAIFETLG